MTDMILNRGDTFTFDVPVVRWNATTNQFDPLPLATVKAWFTVKTTTRDLDEDALIQYNSVDNPGNVIPVGNPANGILRISIPPSDSDSLPVTYLPYDVQIKELTGEVTTVVRGTIQVNRDSTITIA